MTTTDMQCFARHIFVNFRTNRPFFRVQTETSRESECIALLGTNELCARSKQERARASINK